MLKYLKNILASCHWGKPVQIFPFVKEQSRAYCETRAQEAIREALLLQYEADPALYERTMRLAVRLLVVAMFRFRQEKIPEYGTIKTKKNKKKRARSRNTKRPNPRINS